MNKNADTTHASRISSRAYVNARTGGGTRVIVTHEAHTGSATSCDRVLGLGTAGAFCLETADHLRLVVNRTDTPAAGAHVRARCETPF